MCDGVTQGQPGMELSLVSRDVIAMSTAVALSHNMFDAILPVTPLLTRIYPNGQADVNHFHQAGGTAFLIASLLDAGLLHEDVETIMGQGLRAYTRVPVLDSDKLAWHPVAPASGNVSVLRPAGEPFDPQGGLTVVHGNLGRGVIKTSAVAPEHHVVEAPARVFNDQAEVAKVSDLDELDRDVVAVVRWQGPTANGMPELHKLTPYLGSLQDRGYHVALVTDGRMSGASGKVPAAIHVYPEAAKGGPLAKVRDGDIIRVDAARGDLSLLIDDDELAAREPERADLTANQSGLGRELFGWFRQGAASPEQGGGVLFPESPAR